MNNSFGIILICQMCVSMLFAQNAGSVLESQTFLSSSLNQDVKYSIYFPANFERNIKKYPVVYLLHGFSGCETDWLYFGDMAIQADKYIAEEIIPSLVIVMPDGKNSWYVNSPGYGHYEDMIVKDLIQHIENTYSVRNNKEGRAIVGLSMGGNGAFSLAMKNPDIFGAAVSLSGSFWDESYYKERKEDVSRLFEAVYGTEPIKSPLWNNNNPFHFLKKENVDKYNSVNLLFDCGDDDFVISTQLKLSNHLRDMKIDHELRIRDGAHDWNYWRKNLKTALVFCGKLFRRSSF